MQAASEVVEPFKVLEGFVVENGPDRGLKKQQVTGKQANEDFGWSVLTNP